VDVHIELAGTSAWARKDKPGLGWFGPALEDGRIAVCDMVAMELRCSAREGADFRAIEAGVARGHGCRPSHVTGTL